jgi:hypothetical protein
VPRALVLAVLVLASAPRLRAQAPNLDWRTIRTPHFYIHFTRPVEPLARRVAADAERAYAQLARELHPPRGMIDVVLSDDVDFSNGSATPFPTNRIVIYANPPVSESALRYTNDWAQMVITHELTHIFHLDRTRGVWALGQHVFGRAAALFPNLYSPAWITEGLAVYEETRLAGAGRVAGSEHRMIARSAAIDHRFPGLGGLSLAQGRFPFGESAYGFGSLFIDYLARTRGEDRVRTFVEKSSADIIPYLVDIPAKQGFGVSFSRAWRQFSDSIRRSLPAGAFTVAPGWRQLTRDGVFVFAPRWMNDSSLVYSGSPGRESFGAYRVDLTGKRTRIGRRNDRSPNVLLADGSLLYAQSEWVNPYQLRSDLWIARGDDERQITFGQRLTEPDARADGAIVAAQITPGATRLVRVSRDGRTITPLTTGTYDEQWTEPRWSHGGDRIAAVRWRRGNLSQIVVLDTTGRELAVVASGHSIQATPSWAPADSGIYYSSDASGEAQVYFTRLGASNTATFRVSGAPTGLFEPQASPGGDHLGAVLFRSDGYHLGSAACCDTSAWIAAQAPMTLTASMAPAIADSTPSTTYSPWRTLVPRYWLPTISQGLRGGYRIGASTSGRDVIGRHTVDASLAIPTNNTGVTGGVTYQYAGLGIPIIQLDVSQDYDWLGSVFERDAPRTLAGDLYRRTRSAEALATFLDTRVRRTVSLSGGFGLEHRTHFSTQVPIAALDTAGELGSPTFPSVIAAATFANYQRPPFSISPEDGVQASVTWRERFNSGFNGNGGPSSSTVASAAAFKSLDLPGFAHHVLALRASAGIADERAAGYYSVGGISGSTYEIIPGYTIGEGRKTFPVRGFEPGTLLGTRAITASAEYRVPLILTGSSVGALPFFLDRSSLTLFGDYGTAWCPTIRGDREVCNQNEQRFSRKLGMASAGAELNVNLGVLSWDSPYRFRLGVVTPLHNAVFFGRRRWQTYLVGGVSF